MERWVEVAYRRKTIVPRPEFFFSCITPYHCIYPSYRDILRLFQGLYPMTRGTHEAQERTTC